MRSLSLSLSLCSLTPARAEPPGPVPPNPVAFTIGADGLPALQITDARGNWVTVRLEARFGTLSASWVLPAFEAGSDIVVVPLAIPASAFMHRLSESHVTDLRAIVELDWATHTRTGYLAWPQGRGRAPVVWTDAQMRVAAPQGVLDAALRVVVHDPTEDLRIMPDTSDVRVLPMPAFTNAEVEP